MVFNSKLYDLDRDEWKFISIWITILIIVTFIPYLSGYLLASPDYRFSGLVYNIVDQNLHLSWMRQAAEGNILFKNLYTPEEHSPQFFHPLFLTLGLLSKIFHLSLISVYQLARVIFSICLLFSIYIFISVSIKEKDVRKTAFLFSCLASGFGWVFMLIRVLAGVQIPGNVTPDLWKVESITFFTILESPLYTLSIILVLWIFILMIQGFHLKKVSLAVSAGVISLVLGFIHTYDLGIVYAVLLFYTVIMYFYEKNSLISYLKKFLIMVLISSLSLVYNFYVFFTNPGFIGWREQMSTPSQNPIFYVLGYGFLFLLASYYVYKLVSQSLSNQKIMHGVPVFVLCWGFSAFLILYFPVRFSSRFIEGYQIPLAILGAIGLHQYILPKIYQWKPLLSLYRLKGNITPQKVKKFIVTSILLMMIPSNLFVLLNIVRKLSDNSCSLNVVVIDDCWAVHVDEIEGLSYLEKNVPRDGIVLSGFRMGNYIPRFTGHQVFLGHIDQTNKAMQKNRLAGQFFETNSNDQFRKRLIHEYNLKYIFYQKSDTIGEKEIGETNLEELPYLKLEFKNKRVKIYRVIL